MTPASGKRASLRSCLHLGEGQWAEEVASEKTWERARQES